MVLCKTYLANDQKMAGNSICRSSKRFIISSIPIFPDFSLKKPDALFTLFDSSQTFENGYVLYPSDHEKKFNPVETNFDFKKNTINNTKRNIYSLVNFTNILLQNSDQ